MFNVLVTIELTDLRWSSDWNGYEVGYPEVGVVGLYQLINENEQEIYLYIDIDNMKLLEWWVVEDDPC